MFHFATEYRLYKNGRCVYSCYMIMYIYNMYRLINDGTFWDTKNVETRKTKKI